MSTTDDDAHDHADEARSAGRSPRRPAAAPSAALGRPDLRLARDAQGQARPRAAARRDRHPGDVRPDVHLPLRRRDRRLHRRVPATTSCPGILVMSVLFTTVYSGVALNTDLTKGVVDRFRSLPIWRPAPLVGRAARRQRALRARRHGDHRAGRDPGLPARAPASAAWSPRWRWSCSSRSACPGCSPRSGCSCARPAR